MGTHAYGNGLPTITSHSKTGFAVYQGDKLSVAVTAAGDGIEAKWLRSDKVVCRTFKCDFNTAEWGLGQHRMVVVIFNKFGSKTLVYQIKILPAPPMYKPGPVIPEAVVSDEAIESLKVDDFSVQAVSGRGFSYNDKKILVVGQQPRLLDGEEKLKTQTDAVLKFGRRDSEEIWLLPHSEVKLSWGESAGHSGRRLVLLRKGSLRARQIGEQEPVWSVGTDAGLQIDVDRQGDVLVEVVRAKGLHGNDEKNNSFVITVLRGHGRVLQVATGEAGQNEELTLPAGTQVVLKAGEKISAAPLLQPNPAKVARAIAESSPQYIPGAEIPEDLEIQLLKADPPADLNDAKKVAGEALAREDFFAVIEAFLPFDEQVDEDFAAALLLGRAYFGLFMHKYAAMYLKIAAKLAPDNPLPGFYLGMISIQNNKWSKAQEWFDQSSGLGYGDAQALHYYAGVAAHRLDNGLSARSQFTYSLWDGRQPELTQAAKDFLAELDERRWLEVGASLGLFYDSNVMRLPKDSDLPEGLDANIGGGYSVGFDVMAYAFRNQGTHLGFFFDINRAAYKNSVLKNLALLDQQFGVDLNLEMGSGAKPWASVAFVPYVGMVFLGTERVKDIIGTRFKLASPALMNLYVAMDNQNNNDPLPGRDDVLDPTLWERTGTTDRSQLTRVYRLGLWPVETESTQVETSVESETTAWKSSENGSGNFTGLGLGLAVDQRFSLRQSLQGNLGYKTRTFVGDETGRKDKRLSFGAGWKWFYTPALSQRLLVDYLNQSSDAEHTYGRYLLSAVVELRL